MTGISAMLMSFLVNPNIAMSFIPTVMTHLAARDNFGAVHK
jgi:hypothetical protein